MTPRYLLDTNMLSEPVRPTPHPNVMRLFQIHQAALAVAAVTWHEALYGVRRLPFSRRRTVIEQFLDSSVGELSVLPYDQAAAEWHADERARLSQIGLTPPFADGQIASVAATNGLALVTANVADFQHFQGLTVENWRM